MKARFSRPLLIAFFLTLFSLAAMGPAEAQQRNKKVLGCWGAADKGDSADIKLYFVGDGAMVQYDENKTEKNKRTFGAWEMKPGSTFLVIYWPAGNITSYSVKRIGPILHFTGMNGARNFTLREIALENCWSPEI